MLGAEQENKKCALEDFSLTGCCLRCVLIQFYVRICILNMCTDACLFPSRCACVITCVFDTLSLLWSHFETLQVLRSMSLGISYSPPQHKGTKWLMDRWLAGWDEGRCGSRGMSCESRGISHACTHNAYKYTTTHSEDEGKAEVECVCVCVKQRARLSVWVERCPMCLGALERFHAPISNKTHRPTHTHIHTKHSHTHCWAFTLPSYPSDEKTWHALWDRERKKNKDKQSDKSAPTCIY